MLRFWLKDCARIGSHLPGSLVRVKTCPVSDKKYIEAAVCIMDPSMNLPPIPENLLERITAVERIFRRLRTEGLYRRNGVTLTATTRFHNITPKESQTTVLPGMWFSSESLVVECQDICVSAPNLVVLQEVYSQFRQGKLKPTENYELDSDYEANPSESAAPAEEDEPLELNECGQTSTVEQDEQTSSDADERFNLIEIE